MGIFPFALTCAVFWCSYSHKRTLSRNVLTMASDDILPDRIKVLGICGGIGSGKSSAGRLLVSDLGCLACIDSDSLAHTVYEPESSAIDEIITEFGSALLLPNGEIDRKKLGSVVFADISAMQSLERIVWPRVLSKIESQIELAKNERIENDGKHPIIVVEAAVLLDAGWQEFLDGVWVVTVSQNVALERLQANRGMSAEEAAKRIAAQQPRRGIGNLQDEVNAKVVTAVIDNNGSLEDLKQRLVINLHDPNAWNRGIS